MYETNRAVPRAVVDALEHPDVKQAIAKLRGGGARAEHELHTALVKLGITDKRTRDRIVRDYTRTNRWGTGS
jgi:hypothetical protein